MRRHRNRGFAAAVLLAVVGMGPPGCGRKAAHPAGGKVSTASGARRAPPQGPSRVRRAGHTDGRLGAPGRQMMKMDLSSPAFTAGGAIPRKYAHPPEGQNVSPPLTWTGAPAAVKSYALIVDDPDAPSPKHPRPTPWVHWVLWNLPGSVRALPEAGDGGGRSGTSDFGKVGWGGPLPPPGSGRHRYVFTLYALDARLDLPASARKTDLLAALRGHVLARGELVGTYER